MKLASLKHGRDGRLVVVSRDLTPRDRRIFHRADAAGGARRLGTHVEPAPARTWPRSWSTARCRPSASTSTTAPRPLPRAYQWADGSAYVNHVELVRKARGAEMPDELLDRPADVPGRLRRLPRPARSDPARPTRPGAATSRPRSRSSPTTCRWAPAASEALAAHPPGRCWSTTSRLRNLIPGELAKGFGFFQSKPASRLLAGGGDAGRAGRRLGRTASCTCRCCVDLNGKPFGQRRRRRRHDLRLRRP